MTFVRFVLVALKLGVSPDAYERFERDVDYTVAGRMKTIVSYRTHRLTDATPGIAGGPWHYIERIEVTDRKAYEQELATIGKGLIDELYVNYLDRSKTVSFWSERIEP